MIIVKVAKLGQKVVEVSLENGSTVDEALSVSRVDRGRSDVKVNNRSASVTTTLKNGDIITLVPDVKGGQN